MVQGSRRSPALLYPFLEPLTPPTRQTTLIISPDKSAHARYNCHVAASASLSFSVLLICCCRPVLLDGQLQACCPCRILSLEQACGTAAGACDHTSHGLALYSINSTHHAHRHLIFAKICESCDICSESGESQVGFDGVRRRYRRIKLILRI
ncbi:hypothetical protein BDW72DRAFT_31232 [Aspergillus terricola var. indicus]